MPEKLSEAQLQATIAQQIELAKSHDKTERANAREKALDYYMGNMDTYVPPEPNRSKVVSRDVADTIGWMLPGIMRVFTASDRMAIAEPTTMADTQFAKQATDGMNFVFWKDNDGEQIVYDVTWDALLNGNGVVKTFYDDTPVYATSFHSDLSEDQVALLLQPDEEGEAPEVLAQTPHQEMGLDPATGQPVPVTLYDLKIKRKKSDGSFVIDAIPGEEFLIDADAKKTDEAAFTDHWQKKTRSELVAMGYNRDDVWAIPTAARVETPEAAARDPAANTFESTDKSMELVDYHECFIRIDVDGDGEAELVRACYAGQQNGKLLDWEVWEDEHPFDDIKCEPIPHRWLARSVADETVDIQDIKTVLTRQMLNNTYWANNPQRYVTGKVKNPEQLDNPTFGGTVFGEPGSTVTDLPVPYIGDKALAALTYIDEVRQQRTGVGRQSMALDPETLQNQSATAANMQHDAQYSQVEQVARNMAGGWRKVFRKLMRLMIKHQDYTREVMFNGKQVQIDPRYWNADMNVTINVGLGTGSRDRDLLHLQQVLNSQLLLADRFVATGATNDAIELLPKVIQTLTKMAESAGIRNPEEFYPEYTAEKVDALKQLASQPKPNPKIEEIQAQGQVQAQLKNADVQAQLAVEQGRQQTQQQLNQLESERQVRQEQAQLQADLTTKAADRQNAIDLESIKQQGAIQLKQMDIAAQERLHAMDLAHQAALEEKRLANAQTIAKMKPAPKANGASAN